MYIYIYRERDNKKNTFVIALFCLFLFRASVAFIYFCVYPHLDSIEHPISESAFGSQSGTTLAELSSRAVATYHQQGCLQLRQCFGTSVSPLCYCLAAIVDGKGNKVSFSPSS